MRGPMMTRWTFTEFFLFCQGLFSMGERRSRDTTRYFNVGFTEVLFCFRRRRTRRFAGDENGGEVCGPTFERGVSLFFCIGAFIIGTITTSKAGFRAGRGFFLGGGINGV